MTKFRFFVCSLVFLSGWRLVAQVSNGSNGSVEGADSVQVRTEITVRPDAAGEATADPVQVGHGELERVAVPGGSAALAGLVTARAPGVAADSNGTFHPLGEHAEVSYLVDGELVTDQQAPVFAAQVPLGAVDQVEIHESTPEGGVGDKPSMQVVLRLRSGWDAVRPRGQVELSAGRYGTGQGSASLGLHGKRWASFIAGEGLGTGRFLDTPELESLHAAGWVGNGLERVDFRWSERVAAHAVVQWAETGFETPNTYDQQATGQQQRQRNRTWRVAPTAEVAVTPRLQAQFAAWAHGTAVRYVPSSNPYADTPATLQQERNLLHAGVRTAWDWSRGALTIQAGGEIRQTLVNERFGTAITDAGYNSPCVDADAVPVPDGSLRDVSQCAGAGYQVNENFLPGLLALDWTRGGAMFQFDGHTAVKQGAGYVQSTVRLHGVLVQTGLRGELYRGITRSVALQPRGSIAWQGWHERVGVHAGYAREMLTPYNENLIVASSRTPGSLAPEPLQTGRRNQFNVGMKVEPVVGVQVRAEYFWKFTRGAYDFDVLLNSPLAFPTQFRKAKVDGGLVRADWTGRAGWDGFVTVSHVRSRLFGPAVGGLQFSAPYGNVVRPDHDEGLAINATLRKQVGRNGPWFAVSYRYDGGLVAVAVPDAASALRLTGDEQQQMGLYCGAVAATVQMPIRRCSAGFGSRRIRIPAEGTEDDDRKPPRIAVRSVVDLSVGQDTVWQRGRSGIGAQVTVTNVGDVDGLYNFLSTFAGTHFLAGRAVQGRVRWRF